MYRIDRSQQNIYIGDSENFSQKDRERLKKMAESEKDGALRDVYAFLADWFDEKEEIEVQTSGSTGDPKRMWVKKERMVASAIRTCRFFQLKEEDTALLCMNMRYVGAKMMVVRSLVAGMRLKVCSVSSNPLLEQHGEIDFLAVVPLQLYQMVAHPVTCKRLSEVRHVIVGGGEIDASLVEKLHELPCCIYSTYGMTETLSHVALRRLNGTEASECFYPMPGVCMHVEENGTLTIDAVDGCTEQLPTHDLVRFHEDGGFVIIGRTDNIINSGGIKIQIETLEQDLSELMNVPYAVTAVSDECLGESVVLLVQSEVLDVDGLKQTLKERLPRYHTPRYFYPVPDIPRTENGKIDRKGCRELACQLRLKK